VEAARGRGHALADRPLGETLLLEQRIEPGGQHRRLLAAEAVIYDAEILPALDRQIAYAKTLRAKATHDAGVWKLRRWPTVPLVKPCFLSSVSSRADSIAACSRPKRCTL
jgi:uncharacterized protein (DUF885 family)